MTPRTYDSPFVSATDIRAAVQHGRALTILASIWETNSEGGYQRYRAGHIPTALFCDPDAALSGLPGSRSGRNPLPEVEQLQRAVDYWGLRQDRQVVVYDQGHGLFAARAWWVLRWAGVENVAIMGGGLDAWRAAGGPAVVGPGNISGHADVTVRPGSMPVATIEDVKNHQGVLVDVRQPNRYAGRREILDLKAGHIPGAVSIPVDELFTVENKVKTPEQVRERFAAAGLYDSSNVIVYSGSGNHSALALAAMESAGLTGAAHYVGGWSQWSADPKNPVERGD
ncbi:sulfurtransferase [Corynebacterium tapiri]|uniref:thiosulfate sulfurtransferase n=1 Tax=Corynebacterium tapiri TaxID=1448266 RepID=A0A5C4U213_9CORY|nr:sulfurtransferase [Corynebacterium tapiri]TNL95726.1 sulfurtransferase [Corynebacterium tapiri]